MHTVIRGANGKFTVHDYGE